MMSETINSTTETIGDIPENTAWDNLANENATDRDPSDGISPEADASENPHDPENLGTLDDSVDITTEYDDTKAQAIEESLEPIPESENAQHAAWAAEQAEQFEYDIKPQDYTDFANHYIAKMYDMLVDPTNEGEADATDIADQITVATNLLGLLQDQKLEQPDDVFHGIANTYSQVAEIARQKNNEGQAKANERQANAVSRTLESFKNFMAERHAPTAEPEAIVATETTVVEPAPDPDLPADAIS